MTVKRIVPNIDSDDLPETRQFYEALFGLDCAMDMGWVVTLEAGCAPMAQLNIATEGGSGTGVPDLTIEVEDVDDAHARARILGAKVIYGPFTESWGVRRFFLRDPSGTLVNVMQHGAAESRAA